MCNSCNSWFSFNRCGCCGATQSICRDACGNIRVNQCGCNTAQTSSCGCCGTTSNTTTSNTNGNTNGNSNGFGFFTVYGRIVNRCGCNWNTATADDGDGYYNGQYSQYGRCRSWGCGSAD